MNIENRSAHISHRVPQWKAGEKCGRKSGVVCTAGSGGSGTVCRHSDNRDSLQGLLFLAVPRTSLSTHWAFRCFGPLHSLSDLYVRYYWLRLYWANNEFLPTGNLVLAISVNMKTTITGLYTGKITTLELEGQHTGIFKKPVYGPVYLSKDGLDSDQQADRRVHGGSEKAIHHSSDQR